MNYKTLLNDPEWIMNDWMPKFLKTKKLKGNPGKCNCSNEPKFVARIDGGWTCITCYARQQIPTKTCGISEKQNFFLRGLNGMFGEDYWNERQEKEAML